MDKQLIVIKIKDDDPLCVDKESLTENSEFLRKLIDELHFYEVEMDDFNPDIVALFLTLLKDKRLGDMQAVQFRELHKMATVFKVQWLKESCRSWLFNMIDDKEKKYSHDDLLFVFEECLYVLRKWKEKEKDMMETLISKVAQDDNSTFVWKYIENLNKLDEIQLGLMLKLEEDNTDIFLNAMLLDLANKDSLDSNMRFLLQNIDLSLCYLQSQQLYDQLFDSLHNLKELTREDLSLISKLYIETAKSTRTKAAKSTKNSKPTASTA